MGTSVNVQVSRGGQPTGTHSFNSDTHRTIKIGRLGSAQLKLDDPKASKIHAVIDFSGGGVSLIDMGSSAGTLVNGSKVHKVTLSHGDQVTIGDTQLVIDMGAGFAAAAPAPAAAPTPVAPLGAPAPSAGLPASAPPGAGGAPAPAAAAPPVATVPGGYSPPPARAPFPAAPGITAAGTAQGDASSMPRFADGAVPQQNPVERITQARLRSAAVESRPHPSLPPEEHLSVESRTLEMRLYWGQILLSIDHFEKPKLITIGETKGTNVFISSEGLPQEAFPIVRTIDNEYVLTFCAGMEGEVEIAGDVKKLSEISASSSATKDDDLEGSYRVKLPVDARVLIHWGGATFALRFVAPPQPLPASFFKNLDFQYLNMMLFSIVFHIAAVTTFLVYPYDTDALREDLFDEGGRFVDLMLNPSEEKNEDLLEKLKKKVEENKPKEPEKKPELKVTEKTTKKPVKEQTVAQQKADVQQKFSKMFSGSGGGGSLLGGAGGGTLAGTMQNVIGTTGAGKGAMAGLGIRGGIMTGGGVGTSRGVMGIGTAGRLGGGGLKYGSDAGKLGKRKQRGMISLSTPVVMGSLPKEVIKKVIDSNREQIRYCYEIELQKNQELSGKVQMKWIIGATGGVVKTQVTSDTMQSKNVGRCLAAKIKGWKFPAPAGGGIVEVNYPFVFKSS